MFWLLFAFLGFVLGSLLLKKKTGQRLFQGFEPTIIGGYNIYWGTSYWPFMLLMKL